MPNRSLVKVLNGATTGRDYATQEVKHGSPSNRDYWEGEENAYGSIVTLVEQLIKEEERSSNEDLH